jgi:hypothetical protein
MRSPHQITSQTFQFAASVGSSRWYGFATRQEAEAWVDSHANGREATIVPAVLAGGPVVAP